MNAVERKVIGSHEHLTNVSKLLKSCAGSIMATINLPHDFREFFKSLGERHVEYLLIGGYAVAYHGYPRATADIDIWIAIHTDNAVKTVETLKAFGFDLPQVTKDLFLKKDQIIRMGMPPMRIEIATSISGVSFNECWTERIVDVLDGVEVNIISLKHLKINKQAAGRHKDLDDLENLP